MTNSEHIEGDLSRVETRLPFSLFLKSLLIGSRWDSVLFNARWYLTFSGRYKHPELMDLFLEDRQLPFVVQRLMTSDGNAVDVGAHIGSFLSVVLRYAPDGRHIAFEPSQTKSALLRKSFPRVEVIANAVSDQAGAAEFIEDLKRPGFSHLEFNRDGLPARREDHIRAYQVPICRLDDLLLNRRVDLIKLDIEGAELSALRGAKETITRWQPSIIFECGPTFTFEASGLNRMDLFEFISEELGYRIYTFSDFLFDRGGLGPDEFRKSGLYPFRAFNFIALTPGKDASLGMGVAGKNLDFRGGVRKTGAPS